MTDDRLLFGYLRRKLGGSLEQAEVDEFNAVLRAWKEANGLSPPEAAGVPKTGEGPRTPDKPVQPFGGALRLSQAGIDLIHSFEQCKLTAYPDPGSRDGNPWTIGWGSTGPGIARGTVWTQAQADERFKQDVSGREAKLNAILSGAPTTQAQFDALLSLGYNIGMGALAGSTVMRKHRAGDYQGAAIAFAMWNKNDGRPMAGLTRRRKAEAKLYKGAA